MAAVKGGARGKRRPPPGPQIANLQVSRAAMMGDGPDVRGFLAGALLVVGASVAGAAWIGGSLVDAREAILRGVDGLAATAGFTVQAVVVEGVNGIRAEEIQALALPDHRRSLISAAPEDVRARVESLDWVETAQVRRLWPSTIAVSVERRKAVALWRSEGRLSVIDAAGERLFAADPADFPDLPVIEGAGAGAAAQPLLAALAQMPDLERRVETLVRINGRRWDVRLKAGPVVALPEEGAVEALARFAAVAQAQNLYDRSVAQVDLRDPTRIAIRPHDRQVAARPADKGA